MDKDGDLSVAVVDDHAIVRSGLCLILHDCPGVRVCGEAGNLEEAAALAADKEPDVFVVDMQLGDESGIEATRRILKISPATKVLILTMHDDVAYLREAFAAGASGYVLKQTMGDDIVKAVTAVASDGKYVDPRLGGVLASQNRSVNRTPEPVSHLSSREVDVLRLLAMGYTNTEVAETLTISVRTAETHRAHIRRKLGVRSRADLSRLARAAALQHPPGNGVE